MMMMKDDCHGFDFQKRKNLNSYYCWDCCDCCYCGCCLLLLSMIESWNKFSKCVSGASGSGTWFGVGPIERSMSPV